MHDNEREKTIMDVLDKKGTIGVNRLAELVFCSGSTIRRDLRRMEEKGLVKRAFGSVSLPSVGGNDETSFSVREGINIAKKKQLAKTAASKLSSGQTIFIDSSTTLFHIVRHLNDLRDLLIITNGLKIAAELSEKTRHKVIVIGGEVTPNSNSTLGSYALTQIGSFHADVALMSCTGASLEFGLSEANYEIAELKKQMLQNSDKRIAIFDESKFGVNKAFQTCSFGGVLISLSFPRDSAPRRLLRSRNLVLKSFSRQVHRIKGA